MGMKTADWVQRGREAWNHSASDPPPEIPAKGSWQRKAFMMGFDEGYEKDRPSLDLATQQDQWDEERRKKGLPTDAELLSAPVVKAEELSNLRMTAGNEKKYTKVIWLDGRLKEWVGIGWVDLGQASPTDHATYPTVMP